MSVPTEGGRKEDENEYMTRRNRIVLRLLRLAPNPTVLLQQCPKCQIQIKRVRPSVRPHVCDAGEVGGAARLRGRLRGRLQMHRTSALWKIRRWTQLLSGEGSCRKYRMRRFSLRPHFSWKSICKAWERCSGSLAFQFHSFPRNLKDALQTASLATST